MITEKKNHKIKSVDFSIKNKKIAFCSELPFWILSFNSYLSTESMNVDYDYEINYDFDDFEFIDINHG